jgi:hypothetical protein
MKVSIFTTVLEANDKLADSIRSVRSKYPVEHVVTVARNFPKALEMAQKHSWKCKLVSTPGASISAGFTEAVRHSTCDLLWPLNAGDKLVDIDPLIELLDKRPDLDFAYGDILYDGVVVPGRPSPITINTLKYRGMPFCHGAAVYRRHLHDKYGYYPEDRRIVMDLAFLAKAFAGGSQAERVPMVVADIEPAGNSGVIWSRTKESIDVMRPYMQPPLPFIVFWKWVIFSHIGDRLRAMKAKQLRSAAH